MKLFIRPALIEDFESIYSLINDLEGYVMNKDSLKSTLSKNLTDPNIYYLIAEQDTRIVGFISLHVQHILHHSSPTGEIQELIIIPEQRNSGIGSFLIQEVEKIACSMNLEEIELTASIYREKAQSFYRKLGYMHSHNKFVKKLHSSQ